jgi:hypothetical protein
VDFPFLLLALLALPFAVAAAIVVVSLVRRRAHTPAGGPSPEPVHRAQTGTAAVQSAAVPRRAPRRVTSGRERRNGSAERPTGA